jgi:hypothetical protein
MPPRIRSTSRTERPLEVATACSLTACFNSAFSCATELVGGMDGVVVSVGVSLAGRRYRCEEDMVVRFKRYS